VIQAHGMLASRDTERAMGLDFSAVTATHRLVRYDARGHGESHGRPRAEDYAWTALAADLLGLRFAVAGADAVDGIGSSMGAATLLHAAVREPRAFRRLVLIIPPTVWATRVAQASTYRSAADAIQARGLSTFLALMQAQMVPPALEGLDGMEFAPRVRESLLPSVLRGAALSDLPDPATLANLRHPVLILPWADDPAHPISTAERLAEVLPEATLTPPARSPADVSAWGPLTADFLAG
jgi:pimeloyl-ACP methyl ester carboxylesterase